MALNAPTNFAGAYTATSVASQLTSPSFTPSANALVMVIVALHDDAVTIPSPTITSTHTGMVGDWSMLEVSLTGNGGNERLKVCAFLRNAGASPSAGTITVNVGTTIDRIMLRPSQITSTVGSNSAYRKAGSFATVTGTGVGTMTATLPANPTTSNYVFGFCASWDEGDIVAGAGFTELSDDAAGTAGSDRVDMLVEYRTGTTSTSVPVSGTNLNSIAPSVLLAFAVEELSAGTAHSQSRTDTESLTDSTTVVKAKAVTPADNARPGDSLSRALTMVVRDTMTVWDSYPTINFDGVDLTSTAGSVTLHTVWLNDSDDPSDFVSFPTMSKLVAGRTALPEVRRLAGGRHRLIRRAGIARTFTLTLKACDRDQVEWLEDHVGKVVCCRDDRGRKVFGTFLKVDVSEVRTRPDLANCVVALREVYHEEATGGVS